MRWFQTKTEIFYFGKEYHFPDHFRWRSFITPFFFGCHPLFHSGIYHVTCIWPVSKSSSYTPLTLYLACSIFRLLSAKLSLSFSPSHQVTLVSGVWQPRCRCSPVRACLKQDFKTKSDELKKKKRTQTVEHYNTEGFTQPHLSPEVLISKVFSKGHGYERFC